MQHNASYEFIRTQQADLTCSVTISEKKYWLHSRYNPIVEAERFTDSQIAALSSELNTLIVYGFSCGHHIRSLASRLADRDVRIQVWEANLDYLHKVSEFPDVQDLLRNPMIDVIPVSSATQLMNQMENWGDERTALIIHQPSLHLIPDSLVMFRKALEDYQLFWLSVVASHRQMYQNYQANLQKALPGVKQFANFFADIPVILVAAGPSLQKNMMQLKSSHQHCFIATVGTAWRPLVEAGIRPDFVMMTDPNSPMREQLVGLETYQVPLFALSTLYFEVLKQYQGPSYLVFQRGYSHAEQEVARTGDPLIETGGSVATSLYSLAQLFGFSPICWVGLDLAYTNGQTHVPGAHRGIEFQMLSGDECVPSYDRQGTIATSRNLLSYLRWFERIAEDSNVPLYNATEGGAYIQGFQNISLQRFIEQNSHKNIESQRRLWQRLTSMKESVD